ncbi:MAG: SH3 domain-containing protein [Treponema sp.]|jgi:hypothetical protein|nr:SH3 domain-containing protein [Treponema sp.]
MITDRFPAILTPRSLHLSHLGNACYNEAKDFKLKKIFTIFIFFVSVTNIFSQEFPRIMYVTAKNGLNQRSSPQVSSEIIGTLLYGERVVVYERSNSVTINGITDYWYRTDRRIDGFNIGGRSWVFGCYLSAKMPMDVEPVLGYWDTDKDSKNFWAFTPHNRFISARKGPTDIGIHGNWILSGNILTLNLIPVETMSYSAETLIIEIIVVDKDNIMFIYKDNTVEKLSRSDNLD